MRDSADIVLFVKTHDQLRHVMKLARPTMDVTTEAVESFLTLYEADMKDAIDATVRKFVFGKLKTLCKSIG